MSERGLFTRQSVPCLLVAYFLLAFVAVDGEDNATWPFTRQPNSSKSVMEGQRADLECEVDPGVRGNLAWTLNGKEVLNSTRRYFTIFGSVSSLAILRADREKDTGEFRCSIASSDGKVYQSEPAALDILWLEEPEVSLYSPHDGIVKANVDVVLRCDAELGNADYQYQWFRNAERVLLKGNVHMTVKVLLIKHATVDNNGLYRCAIHLNGESVDSIKNYALAVKDKSVPHISVIPLDLLLPPKSSAVFNCQYKMADSVEWFKNDLNVPMENNDKVTLHKNGSLVIKNLTRRDEGYYSCVAYRNDQKTPLQSYAAKLLVAYIKPLSPNDFEPALPEYRVLIAQEGDPYETTCLNSKENLPPAQIMWKNKDGHLISDEGPIRVYDGTLVIDEVTLAHQGIYTCVSENVAGSQEMNVFLIISPLPKFTKRPQSVTVDENHPSNMRCEYSVKKPDLYLDLKQYWNRITTQSYLRILSGKFNGHQKKHGLNNHTADAADVPKKESLVQKWLEEFNWDFFELKWKKDTGKTVKEEQGHTSISTNDGLLSFLQSTVSDRGVYWCEITTVTGKTIKSEMGSLAIRENLKFAPPPVNKRLELNSTARVHCKVQGSPPPVAVWYRSKSDPLPAEASSVNGTLLFSRVSKEHNGTYTCVAENVQGKIETTIQLDVVVAPRFLSPLPSQVIEISEGDPVWINCVAVGDPEPKTQWDRNLDIIHTTEDDLDKFDNVTGDAINRGDGLGGNRRIHLMENGTLYINSTKYEDSDKYGCTAGNSAGLKREEVTLIVHTNGNTNSDDGNGMIGKAVLIIMSVVAAYILLVVGLMLYCRHRRKRKLSLQQANEKLENGDIELADKDGQCDRLIENTDDAQNGQDPSKKNKCNGSGKLRAKNGNIKRPYADSHSGTNESGPNRSDNSELSNHSKGSKRSGASHPSSYERLAMSRNCLRDLVTIGRGEFGDIILGKLDAEHLRRSQTSDSLEAEQVDVHAAEKKESKKLKLVMIKSLTQVKDEVQLAEFKRQLDMFSKLRHENITRIIGLCNEKEPHYLVFQYTDWGDLKQFLLATRSPAEVAAYKEKVASRKEKQQNSDQLLQGTDSLGQEEEERKCLPALNLEQILALCLQIGKGMEFIADGRMIHKDLATRNCLITSQFQVKVSIPAVTKGAYSQEYCKHQNQIIPLRWLPQECVYDSDYSTKSDVYMFACTVWEIFHKAELPFVKMSDTKVLTHLKTDTLKWAPHEITPHKLIEQLEKCWNACPKNRPTFNMLSDAIHSVLSDLTKEMTE